MLSVKVGSVQAILYKPRVAYAVLLTFCIALLLQQCPAHMHNTLLD